MLLSDWIKFKTDELLNEQKYRKAEFDRALEVKLSRRFTSFELFGAPAVPLHASVREFQRTELPEEDVKGVMVWLNTLPPRKRKVKTESFYLLLV